MPFLASERCFWPLTAFMRLDVKNDHAHVLCAMDGLGVMLIITTPKVHLTIQIHTSIIDYVKNMIFTICFYIKQPT